MCDVLGWLEPFVNVGNGKFTQPGNAVEGDYCVGKNSHVARVI